MKVARELLGAGAVALLLGLVVGLALDCGGDPEPPAAAPLDEEHPPSANLPDDPPRALRDTLNGLLATRRPPVHPADGGGRAWLEPDSTVPAQAGRAGHWTIGYEAGPAGIAPGGFVRLTVPYVWWWWSAPQLDAPEAPGYTTATCAADGVTLEARTTLLGLEFVVRGRALAAGERVQLVYGAGPALATADRYAERESPFWIGVDGDGDGSARILADSPTVDVAPGPAQLLSVVLPSTAEPGESVLLRLAFLDGAGSRGAEFVGDVTLVARPEGLELPATVAFTAEDHGVKQVELRANAKGVFRLLARAEDEGGEFLAQANPLLVDEDVAPVRWADFHGHSNISDGTGTPEDFYAYARDVAGLDVACLTDHDHWGMLFLDDHPELWARIGAASEHANEPGRFVALRGFEWTNWIHGHRHVVYFSPEGEVLSSIDERYDTPTELWDALRGRPALTFAHHSAGEPVPTNWNFAPDAELEPVTEVASVHGSSESADTPQRIGDALEGNYVRDALDKGYALGFVGSGDSHDGHPGLCHLVAPQMGGLAALLTKDLTREGVRKALLERRCYATNGARILLRAALDGKRMGSTVAPKAGKVLLYVRAIACAPIATIELVRGGKVAETQAIEGHWDVETAFQPEDLRAGEYLYVRVVQADGGAAWSSPFFIR